MENKLVCYIRGGLGDVYPAVSAIKSFAGKKKINKQNILVITDSVYYFRDYPKALTDYSIEIIRLLTNNIITISPQMNNNFWLEKNGKRFDDTTDELSQEEVDKYMNEFMFWRPLQLKDFVRKFLDNNTIFIDALFTECIMVWNENKYKRIDNDRFKFEFNPPQEEEQYIDLLTITPQNILIHTRKKVEGDAYTTNEVFYNEVIEYCNLNDIKVIVVGVDGFDLRGEFYDFRGSSPFSFQGMAYLIDKCKVMLGNDSGFSAIKLYQQQKDKLVIMDYPRWSRSGWYFRAIGKPMEKSNYLLLDARENNLSKIKKAIGDYYER